jgi:AAT family amino acid transporter
VLLGLIFAVGFSAESSRIQLFSTIVLIAGIAAACRFGARYTQRSHTASADRLSI